MADEILNGADVAHDRTGLNLGNGVLAQDGGGTNELNPRKHGGLAEQRVRGDPDPGQNTPAPIDPLLIQGIHCGGGPKVQHHQRLSILLHRRHTGDRPVRTQVVLPFILDARRHIIINENGLFSKILDNGTGERIHHLGHHGGDDDIADLVRGQIEPPKVFTHRQPNLIRGPVGVCHQAKTPHEFLPLQ